MKSPLRYQNTFQDMVHGWLAYSGLISAALLFMGCFIGASGLVAALVVFPSCHGTHDAFRAGRGSAAGCLSE